MTSNQILRDFILERLDRNPSFSLRAIAKRLGVSHTYLSLVMHGKKRLTPKRVLEFAQLLGLDDDRAQLFIRTATQEFLKEKNLIASPKRANEPSSVDRYMVLELDKYKILSQWYHIAILDLTQLAGFKSDIQWIASRLAITPLQADSAIQSLLRVGLLKREKGRWVKTHKNLDIPTEKPEKAIQEFHSQMIQKALGALQSPKFEDYQKRDITGSTIPLDPKKLPEAKKLIERFRKKLISLLSEGEPTELYQLNVQLFQLTKTEKETSL